MAESLFSRLRRVEVGVHHRISGLYLCSHAGEMACREDNRPCRTDAGFHCWRSRNDVGCFPQVGGILAAGGLGRNVQILQFGKSPLGLLLISSRR